MTRLHDPDGQGLEIPAAELVVRASRAGGPGGQHVNTSSTRVEVRWNVATGGTLTEEQRARLMVKLATRLDAEGWLRVVDAGTRSQTQNKTRAIGRLHDLVARALLKPKPRRRTRVPRAERAKRLEAKRRRGTIKQQRGKVPDED